jgi:hypothetical protein
MIAVIARFEPLDEQRQFDARGAQQLSLVGGFLLEQGPRPLGHRRVFEHTASTARPPPVEAA